MDDDSEEKYPYPRYLTVPFIFVPRGMPEPPELIQFKRDFPGWVSFPATFTLTEPEVAPEPRALWPVEAKPEPGLWDEPDLWEKPARDARSQAAYRMKVHRANMRSGKYRRPTHRRPRDAALESVPPSATSGTPEAQAQFVAACWAAHDAAVAAAAAVASVPHAQTQRRIVSVQADAAGDTHHPAPAQVASTGSHAAQPTPSSHPTSKPEAVVSDPLIATPEGERAFREWLAGRSVGESGTAVALETAAHRRGDVIDIAEIGDSENEGEEPGKTPEPPLVPLSPFYNASQVRALEEEGVPPLLAREIGEADEAALLGAEIIGIQLSRESREEEAAGKGPPATPTKTNVPLGFSSQQAFANFASTLDKGLVTAGYSDAQGICKAARSRDKVSALRSHSTKGA